MFIVNKLMLNRLRNVRSRQTIYKFTLTVTPDFESIPGLSSGMRCRDRKICKDQQAPI
jgi:hypothetical protein